MRDNKQKAIAGAITDFADAASALARAAFGSPPGQRPPTAVLAAALAEAVSQLVWQTVYAGAHAACKMTNTAQVRGVTAVKLGVASEGNRLKEGG